MQKRPKYTKRHPPHRLIYIERAFQKRHTKETYVFQKRPTHETQKHENTPTKEIYIHRKRLSKETYIHKTRHKETYKNQKRPTD